MSNLTEKNLADVIIAVLVNMNFPICNLVGKGFDGASNMSGKDEGVQQHLTTAGANIRFENLLRLFSTLYLLSYPC